MHVLMLVMSNIIGDARVRREAGALAEAGHAVHVLGRGPRPPGDLLPGVTATWIGARSPLPGGGGGMRTADRAAAVRAARWLFLPTHRRLTERAWRRAASRQLPPSAPDVVHAHDLPTLGLAVDLASRWGAPVVYDSHECWTGRRYEGRPAPLALRRQQAHEMRLGHEAAAVLTVSPPLAEWFEAAYRWPHVHVVRNSFAILPERPPPLSAPRGVVYAGRVGAGRDLATLARAAHRLPLPVTIAGPRDEGFLSSFDPGHARVADSVSLERIPLLLAEHGVAAVTLEDTSVNHRVALPNKLFQAVQAGVPVVAADLPALRQVVHQHAIGRLYRPGSVDSFVEAVVAVVDDYPKFVAAVLDARTALSWERDRATLLGVYDRLPRTR